MTANEARRLAESGQSAVVRAKESTQMTRGERRKAYPHTLIVYHRGPDPDTTDIERCLGIFRAGNPLFRINAHQILGGTTKSIGHIPVGYRDLAPTHQSLLHLV